MSTVVNALTGTVKRHWFGLAVAGVTWAILLLWWGAYYPGLFSPDSLAYIYQVSTGHWDNHHSVLYDGLVWLSLEGTGGVAALTLLQTAATAAGLGYAAAQLRRLGAPAWLLAVMTVGLVALPSVGTFVICLWKDVGYVIPSLFALAALARLVRLRRDDTPVPRSLWWELAAELTIVALMRPNGFAVAAATGVLAALALRGVRRLVLAVGLGAAAVALLLNFAVFPALGARNVFGDASAGPTFGDIAVLYAEHPADFAPADLTLMQTVAPLDLWRRTATCVSSDATFYAAGFDTTAADAHLSDFTQLWSRLLRTDPGAVIGARLCRASVGWKPFAFSPADGLTGNPANGFAAYLSDTFRQSPYADAVFARPLSKRLHKAAVSYSGVYWGLPSLEPVLWRGAFWAYLSYLALIVAALRRRSVIWLSLGALTVANQLVVLAQTPVPAARYMFAPLMLGPLLICLAFVPQRPPLAQAAAPSAVEPSAVEPAEGMIAVSDASG